MRLVEKSMHIVTVELSESNLRALLADFEREGRTSLTKSSQNNAVTVRVRRDDEHYSIDELADRGPNWKGAANA